MAKPVPEASGSSWLHCLLYNTLILSQAALVNGISMLFGYKYEGSFREHRFISFSLLGDVIQDGGWGSAGQTHVCCPELSHQEFLWDLCCWLCLGRVSVTV